MTTIRPHTQITPQGLAAALILELDGYPTDFAFSVPDLEKLLKPYGGQMIQVFDPIFCPDVAVVEFATEASASRAQSDLNGLVIMVDGNVCVLKCYRYDVNADSQLIRHLEAGVSAAINGTGPELLCDPFTASLLALDEQVRVV